MPVYSFKRVQYIPCTLEQAWDFFSKADNLPKITPQEMGFNIISKYSSDRIYAGQLIEYRLRPLPFMRVYWMTEITHVVEGKYFVDEQRRGPYRLWHHQHHFREIPVAGGGVGIEMTDIVHYQLPFGFLGTLVHGLVVKKKLEGIFEYRVAQIEKAFGRWSEPFSSYA